MLKSTFLSALRPTKMPKKIKFIRIRTQKKQQSKNFSFFAPLGLSFVVANPSFHITPFLANYIYFYTDKNLSLQTKRFDNVAYRTFFVICFQLCACFLRKVEPLQSKCYRTSYFVVLPNRRKPLFVAEQRFRLRF